MNAMLNPNLKPAPNVGINSFQGKGPEPIESKESIYKLLEVVQRPFAPVVPLRENAPVNVRFSSVCLNNGFVQLLHQISSTGFRDSNASLHIFLLCCDNDVLNQTGKL